MDWTLFQLACVAVLAVAYGLLTVQTPRGERGRLWLLVGLIAVGAWLGEETSILRYRFYGYPDDWWLKLDEVPLLVVAIWPLVVLTADQVIRALWPGLSRVGHAAAIAAMVFVDASLVETVAVAADLWFWVEGGYLGAPLIGLVGWAAYAFSIALFLPAAPGSKAEASRLATWLGGTSARALAGGVTFQKMSALIVTLLVSLAVTHALLVVCWWALFRHALRGALPEEIAYGVLALGALAAAWLWRRGRRMPLGVAGPRALATSVFVVLLVLYADGPPLYLHFLAVALPYFAILELRLARR